MTSGGQFEAETSQPPWLEALADTLLPGGDGWPAASAAGIVPVLAERILEGAGPGGLALVEAALGVTGGAWAGDEAARIAAVAAFEAREPALFGRVLDAAYYAYYESPLVVAAIQAKGRPYQQTPHQAGFPMRPFDPARDMPRHGRGSFVATDAVRFVDPAPLDLEAGATRAWGLRR